LNRNFPDYFKSNTKRPQPETEAVKDWISKIQFLLSGSLHGGALVCKALEMELNDNLNNYIQFMNSEILFLFITKPNNGSLFFHCNRLPATHSTTLQMLVSILKNFFYCTKMLEIRKTTSIRWVRFNFDISADYFVRDKIDEFKSQ
jgi:hypothetical protein